MDNGAEDTHKTLMVLVLNRQGISLTFYSVTINIFLLY